MNEPIGFRSGKNTDVGFQRFTICLLVLMSIFVGIVSRFTARKRADEARFTAEKSRNIESVQPQNPAPTNVYWLDEFDITNGLNGLVEFGLEGAESGTKSGRIVWRFKQ